MNPFRAPLAVLVLGLAVAGFAGIPAAARAAENPAFWKYHVKGDFNSVLKGLKRGLEAAQFILTAEENLSKGLENNKHLFPDERWNTIGFDNVTAVHFCSVVFNQEVFNIDMDWSVLCPFKAVVYTMKETPGEATVIILRPTYLLAKDPHKKAREIGRRIEERIIGAIQEGLSY